MANNFRITGNYYISKAGHDSNDGLTPDTPKKSLPGPNGRKLIIGAGYYSVSADFLPQSNGQYIWGDGNVIIDLSGATITTGASSIVDRLYNVTLKNAAYLHIRNTGLYNCTMIDIASLGFNMTTMSMVNTVVINVNSSVRFNSQPISNSIFLNYKGSFSTGRLSGSRYIITNCYFDQSCELTAIDVDLGNGYGFMRNCNINGIINIGGIKYAIQDQFTGTPQDNGYAADVYWLNEANLTANGYTGIIVGWDAAVATCINRAPKFNNASKLDFTLQADSPHIGRASDGFSNIGGTEYAQSFYAGISNPNILLFEVSEAIDATTNNNDWRLKSGYNEGWIRAIVKVSNNDVQISSIPYIGNYAFDSDQAGGSSTNMNVPDSKPVTNEYPDYLTVTTQAANDTTLIIAGHGAVVGEWLWVDGQYREITGVPDADTITFATSLRAIVVVGTVVKIGTFEALASLNPNRLNMKMRSSKLSDVNASNWDNPLTWDNDGLSPAGQYMAQEWNNAPMIDSLNEVGFGDDSYDANYGNPINLKVVDIMIYLRNNYRS